MEAENKEQRTKKDVWVKICGLRRMEDIALANEVRPDAVGFVFAPGSRRYVTMREAAALRDALDEKILSVGVFVNEDPAFIAQLLERGIIGAAQLHGQETEEDLARLRALTDKPVFQAYRIETEADIERAASSKADRILVDHGAGGTGRTFDWSLLLGLSRPFVLAGGLTPENIAQALQQVAPFGVDASSGLETDGVKDPAKVRKFMEILRGAPIGA